MKLARAGDQNAHPPLWGWGWQLCPDWRVTLSFTLLPSLRDLTAMNMTNEDQALASGSGGQPGTDSNTVRPSSRVAGGNSLKRHF